MTSDRPLEFSLAYLTVIGTPPLRMVEIASDAGYDYVSVRFNRVTADEAEFPYLTDPSLIRHFNRKLRETGVRVLDAELIRLGPDDDPADYERFVEVAAAIGARHLIIQLPDPNRARAAEKLAAICSMAAPYGMTVDLEFIPWTATPDLDTAADIVGRVNHPAAGILVDTLHFERSGSSLSQLHQLSPKLFHFVQLCDAPREAPRDDEGLIRAARTARTIPGQGGLDLRPVVEALPRVPYSLEVPNEVTRKDIGTCEFAKRLLVATKEFLALSEERISVLN